MRNVSRLPSLCPTWPAASAPITVPTNPIATVNPFSFGFNPYKRTSASIAPEITTVSKPKSKPPRAPVTVALISWEFSRILFPLKFQTIVQTGPACGKPAKKPVSASPCQKCYHRFLRQSNIGERNGTNGLRAPLVDRGPLRRVDDLVLRCQF